MVQTGDGLASAVAPAGDRRATVVSLSALFRRFDEHAAVTRDVGGNILLHVLGCRVTNKLVPCCFLDQCEKVSLASLHELIELARPPAAQSGSDISTSERSRARTKRILVRYHAPGARQFGWAHGWTAALPAVQKPDYPWRR